MSEVVFPKGMSIKRNPKSPDFVIGKISIKLEDFVPFCQQNENDGWINIEVLKKKADNSPYLKLDTWKPEQQPQTHPEQPAQGFEEKYDIDPADDIAF
jgi:hypothetical protein